jgi:putative nucleotidyltransferase with HDIG domain
MRNYSFLGPLLAVSIPFMLFESLKFGLIEDPFIVMPKGHFYIVSIVATLATIIAIAVGIAGNRVRNIKVSFLSLSFISLAQMFAIHGLSTPNYLLHTSHLPGVSAQLSMVLATVWLWLSSLPTDNKVIEYISRHNKYLVLCWVIALSIFGIIGLINPHIVDMIPLNVQPLNGVFTIITIALNLITMFRYYQSYRFSQFPLQISIVYSAGWIIVSQLIMVLGDQWRLSWWIYHFLLLASMIVMLVGLFKQYAVKGSLAGALRALFTNDPFERISGSVSPSVKALIIATEKKDNYTAGHTFRVTMYAMKLAEELEIKPEMLRALAQGTLLHDVGKIHIPDSILNKPGNLSLEERLVIEEHPGKGYEMCRGLGFMKEELGIIRSHHEKWDGTGYPDRLQGEKIPYLARITAVADVYDALTSERSYRKAWEHQKAMNFLIENKRIHFDPVCVDGWVRICEKNPSVYLYPAEAITEKTTSSLLSSI